MNPRSATVFLAAVLLAGGGFALGAFAPSPPADAGATDEGAGRGAPRAETAGPLQLTGAIAGSRGYSEPTVDFSPDGRMFVTAIEGISVPVPGRSPIWEFVDGQWVLRGTGPERRGEIGEGDADLEFDANGHGYHTDLWLANNGVSFSEDGGTTWTGFPVSHYTPIVDRQWFAHHGGDHLYLVTNQLAGGIVVFRYEIGLLGPVGAFMAPQEAPTGCRCGPPGFPAVDQDTGNLYVPVKRSGKVAVLRSTDDGLTFATLTLRGSGEPILFPVAAVDGAGHVYVAWSERAGDGSAVKYSFSADHGETWATPREVSHFPGNHVMPWIVAGDDGRVAVAWYGTDVPGDTNDDGAMQDAQWRVYLAQSLDAASASPTWSRWDLVGVVHHGSVSTGGLLGSGDRSLGDFMSAAVSPTDGSVWVAFVRNDPDTPFSQRGVWVHPMPADAAPLLAG